MIGGAGVFGARLAKALADMPGIEVIIAGRDFARAEAMARKIGARSLRLDRADPVAIAVERPFLVIDAAGPFQGDPHGYPVATAALVAGAHYLDLSDDAAFTAGITELDGLARAKALVCLSGVSSVPALSAAAVRALSEGLHDLHLIESVILPGNRAPRGLSVMRAILAQAGQPVPFWQNGQPAPVPGWSRPRRTDIGQGPRWASPIGAPDLVLFPQAFDARSVRFHAGLELSVMHLGLWALTLPVRLGLMRSLTPLARPLLWLANRMRRFGTDRGGMRVRVAGMVGPGRAEARDWILHAEAGDGPEVPTLPARALVASLQAGTVAPGARPCLDLDLAAICHQIGSHQITTLRRAQPFPLLFNAAVDLATLHPAICDLHSVIDQRQWAGLAQIERGQGRLSWLVGAVLRFPPAGRDVPVTVTMDRRGQGEVWTRRFGSHSFRSTLSRPRRGPGLVERFGPLSFRIALKAGPDGLHYPVTQGWCLGIPLPGWLLPDSDTVEAVDTQGRVTFDVCLSHRWTGLVVRYRGWLADTHPPVRQDHSRK